MCNIDPCRSVRSTSINREIMLRWLGKYIFHWSNSRKQLFYSFFALSSSYSFSEADFLLYSIVMKCSKSLYFKLLIAPHTLSSRDWLQNCSSNTEYCHHIWSKGMKFTNCTILNVKLIIFSSTGFKWNNNN